MHQLSKQKILKNFVYAKYLKIYNNIKIAVYLKKNFSDIILSIFINYNSIVVNVNYYHFLILINIIKNSTICLYNQLLDICAIDNLEISKNKNRFSIIYNLISISRNSRIFVKTFAINSLSSFNSFFSIYRVKSISDLFYSANWLERENWDMFGLFFEGNKDLRRILTDYSFEGFPLRKDFPLSGFFDLNYNIYEKRIVINKLEYIQENKITEYNNNWI